MEKIYVVCPGNSVTGGPELLHQLVSILNDAGCDASIIYSPFNFEFTIPEKYSKYNIKVSTYQSVDFNSDCVVVIPEVFTGYAKKFPNVNKFIWWLSVDNYFEKIPRRINEKVKHSLKRFFKHKNAEPKQIPISKLVDCKHLAQSKYAADFLAKKGYESYMLSDFLSEEHLRKNVIISKKTNIICYNPKKGAEITKDIIGSLPHYKFVPIQNMTAAEVADLLACAKVYIDFGNHPGKDRIPREAAMAYCVIITGTRGSAKNQFDIPVPEKYKIAENSLDFISKIDIVLNDAINEYDKSIEDFEEYRLKIKSERNVFEKQALDLFGCNNKD